jgi:hypothetical protein
MEAQTKAPKKRHMNTTIKLGMTILATSAFLGTTLPSEADGPTILMQPGLRVQLAKDYARLTQLEKNRERLATVAVSKSGQGIGEQQTVRIDANGVKADNQWVQMRPRTYNAATKQFN